MTIEIDLTILPSEHHYEDRYRGYIEIFKRIAHIPGEEHVLVKWPPASWLPLLRHLNCETYGQRYVFEHCQQVHSAMMYEPHDRTMVEVLCNFRPETADCLWKCDMQWDTPPGRVKRYNPKQEFIVTTNGAYHRPEVLTFLKHLNSYQPTKDKVLLVPCAADKPYPSAMHKACLEILPDDYYIMNATGVLGLVPQDLWPIMPWYDSGIPNRWRLFETVKRYFAKHNHSKVVVYCDFYSIAIRQAFKAINQEERVSFVLPPIQYDDYVDLLNPDCLTALKASLRGDSNDNGNGRGSPSLDV